MSNAAPAPDDRETVVYAYTRLSNDPGGARADHVTQKRHIADVAARHGLPEPTEWFTDDDRSASKMDVERPGWLEMLDNLRRIDRRHYRPVVVASAQDRLTRRLDETPVIANLLERAGGALITQREGEIGVKVGGRAQLYVQSFLSTDEAERITSRTRAGMETTAMQGKRHGPVPYGWTFIATFGPDGLPNGGRMDVNPETAAIVNECAMRLLAGDSLRAICNDLNRRGIQTPGAGRKWRGRTVESDWKPILVRQLVMRPANVAIRVHVQAHTGIERRYPATWPPIMDQLTYRRVCNLLADESRRSSTSNVARHMLSGIAVCDVCGHKVVGQVKKERNGERKFYYRCPASHVFRGTERVDDHVTRHVLDILASDEIRKLFGANVSEDEKRLADHLEALKARKEKYREMLDNDQMDAEDFAALSRRVRGDIAQAERDLSRFRDASVFGALLTETDIDKVWEGMPLTRQKAVLSALFDIRIGRSGTKGRGAPFDASSITIDLKG